MANKRPILSLLVSCLCLVSVHGQSTIPTTGGNATGSGGSVSYSVGQVTYRASEGTTGTVAQGVQQPYEISVVTAIENTEGIILEYKVFPNPAHEFIKLTIKPFDDGNFMYRLHDLNGILLKEKIIESEEIEISLESFTPSMYFLQVIKDNQEVKVFKIITK